MIGKAVFPGGNAQSLNDITGQPIAEYVHTKSGTLHKLEGPENAKYISFKATGDYNDGDTWTLNNTPVTVTYNGGEELLPTAVLVGDVVQAVVMGNQVRLMLQKPVPQDSLTENLYFINPINQRGKTEYTTNGYTIDRWKLDGAGMVSIDKNKIILAASSEKTLYFTQFLSLSDEMLDKTITFTILLANGSIYYATGTIRQGIYIKNIISGWISCYMVNAKPGIVFSVGKSLELEPVAVKLEPGDRFTGWPAWDYGAELAKCQRYQIEIFDKKITGQSYLAQVKANRSTSAYGILPIPVSMRDGVIPVIETDCSDDNPYLAFGIFSSGYIHNGKITKINIKSKMNNGFILEAIGSNFVAGNDYQIYVENTNMRHFLLNANL